MAKLQEFQVDAYYGLNPTEMSEKDDDDADDDDD